MEYKILMIGSFLFMFGVLILIAKVIDNNIKENEFNNQLKKELWQKQK